MTIINRTNTNFYDAEGDSTTLEGLDEWELSAGALRPKAGVAPNGVIIGTDAVTNTATGDASTGNYETASNTIEYAAGAWKAKDTINNFNYGNYNTDATTPYVVSDSGHRSTLEGWLAFDGNEGDGKSWGTANTDPASLDIAIGGSGLSIYQYKMRGNSVDGNYSPKAWTIYGWDGADWVLLDTQTGASFGAGISPTYTIAQPAIYTKYRITVTETQGVTVYAGDIYEIYYYETPDVVAVIPQTGTVAYAPATLVIEDENNASILGSGKVKVSYEINGGGYSSLMDFQDFKLLSASLFTGVTALKIKVYPVGTQKFTDVDLTTTSADVEITPEGEVKVNLNGVEAAVLTDKADAETISVITADTAAADKYIYVVNGASSLKLTLPETMAVGFSFKVVDVNSNGWEVWSNASATAQKITYDTATSLVSSTSNIQLLDSTSANGAAVELLCYVANADLVALNSMGTAVVSS